MKTLYVGGRHFFNTFSNLEAAIERAENDDIIELNKDLKNVSVTVTKNITIKGNNHTIVPAEGKTALDCVGFMTLETITFQCPRNSNAVIIRNGGNMNFIETITESVSYPTVIQRGGTLVIEYSSITAMETYKGHGNNKNTVTMFQKSTLKRAGHSFSKFADTAYISDSIIYAALFEGNCTLTNVKLKNYNKLTGTAVMKSCRLDAVKDESDNIPYALCIAGGKAMVEEHVSDMDDNCYGFYMTKGSLVISNTKSYNESPYHKIKGGNLLFNNTVDNGYYEIENARCSMVRSKVNTSQKIIPAMEELNQMIGLETVKEQLRTIMNTIDMNQKHPEKDFGFSHHMVFSGDPGTGKTTVAKLTARALFEIGAIREDKCMEVPASQLIKGFVGQTGEHVESIMKQALGGVLFIDEAYELMVKEGQSTFNNDALAVLLRYMEDHRDDLIIIAAGYEKEMKEFLASNVGLTRRFQWVDFEDYTTEELVKIFKEMAGKLDESYAFDHPEMILTYCFDQLTGYYLSHPDSNGRITNGGNGGLARNLFQQVVFARNNRVADNPDSIIKFTYEDVVEGFENEMKKAVKVLGN